MAPISRLVSLTLLAANFADAIDIRMGVKSTAHIEHKASTLSKREQSHPLELLYPTRNLSVPVDHFQDIKKYEPHSNDSFSLRYWFDASYYEPGGPVIILQGGETDGSGRLPFLQKGILHQLAKATHGIGVVLEHRYYGESWPVPDLSTKNFRFLTTEQALADEAYFASNVQFPGMEKYGDLTAKTTPYISYGGSYAGAFSALLRVQYPEVFWGSISSSGVTKAIWDYWAYFVPIAESAPQACVASQRALVSFIDNILFDDSQPDLAGQLKAAYGLQDVTHDNDFAMAVTVNPLGSWQALNWDPAVSSNAFYEYCDNITSTEVIYPDTEAKRSEVEHLVAESGCQLHVNHILNSIGYINATQVKGQIQGNMTQEQYFGSAHNETFNALTSIEDASWKSWPYQYCTEWGYLQTGNTPPEFGLPLVSRTIDLEYSSLVCQLAFNRTEPADVETINKFGAFDIEYPRLAIVDGDWDPWKPATPHAFQFGAKNRSSTASEPFILISEAVHHWDENGLFPNQTAPGLPPSRITETQRYLEEAVQSWMLEWELAKNSWHQEV
ncbi:Putative peptidase S28, alpha/Beta hydrolase [Septoria linicola]|uniref:Peptidase S28, alpha/Beta hydrolase n=1 Tax=Septoria linicola TaxID=215465 RepID=A0A9Q9ADA2_9PEZI|nr:putative peptidase S28, alpha/Beta hydrolase [Septoria linicola]USW47434.1 Putative peptidase S28, alpha/Beta hydrolase [Septoria linicola]